MIAALAAALDYLRQGGEGNLVAGRESLIAGAELCAQMTRAAVAALGLRLFAPTSPATALTAVVPPAALDSSKLVAGLREQFGAVVANGQGEMKGKLFRIAHIGYYDYLDTIGVIGALEHVLGASGAPVELGAGLRAAQQAYASAAEALQPAAARA